MAIGGTLTDWEIVREGIEHPQYYSGLGTVFTDYDHVVIGVGNDEREAFEDALENIAQAFDVDVTPIEEEVEDADWGIDIANFYDVENTPPDNMPQWYVGVRFTINL